jgi:hypothetical protein
VLPIIREAQKAGARTLREIAEALNARGIATARGGQWCAQSVAIGAKRLTIGLLVVERHTCDCIASEQFPYGTARQSFRAH